MQFFDTDSVVEEREGASVCDIFRYEGVKKNNDLQKKTTETSILEGCVGVVSTGGGLPLWGDFMERMNGAGHTVYLRRTAEQIAERLTPYGRRKRPKLNGLNDVELVEYMRSDMPRRELFCAKAHSTVECGAMIVVVFVALLSNEFGDGRR